LNVPRLAVFAQRDCDDSALKVNVLPAKPVLFASAHSGVKSNIKFCLVL
jgi:hypothetical protein